MLNPNNNPGRGAGQYRIDHSYIKPRRRWYDARPILFHALELLESVPHEVCVIVAGEINHFAEAEYGAHRLMEQSELKNIGKEKVLALYRSKNRQRHLDQCAALHKLLNYLFVLPEKQQYSLATQILGVSAIVYDYCSTCRVFEREPQVDEIRRLSNLYFGSGIDGAKGALELLKAELRLMAANRMPVT